MKTIEKEITVAKKTVSYSFVRYESLAEAVRAHEGSDEKVLKLVNATIERKAQSDARAAARPKKLETGIREFTKDSPENTRLVADALAKAGIDLSKFGVNLDALDDDDEEDVEEDEESEGVTA